jgi:hypothetical protein
MRTQIWSNGGGVQSAAIAALICRGDIAKPELALIVDTERELSTTWEYLEEWIRPALKSVGVEMHKVCKSRYATVDLMRNDDVLIPAFTSEGEEVGKLPTFCSNEWKKRVMQRWATDQGVEQADIWMGFSIDEMRRCSQPTGKWQHRYPLIEKRMNRGDCIGLVKSMGWPDPPRSSCYMCPNKTTHEWQWQKENAPDDFAKAVQFEKELQIIDEDMWLTQKAIPLQDVDFSDGNQQQMFGSCIGGCFT